MATLQDDLKEANKKVDKLIALNQRTYIKEEGGITPIGTDWSLDDQNEMFSLLMSLTKEMEHMQQKIKTIF